MLFRSATYAYEEETGWGASLAFDHEEGNFVIFIQVDENDELITERIVVDGSTIETNYERDKSWLDIFRERQIAKQNGDDNGNKVEIIMVP